MEKRKLSMPYWCVGNPVGDPFGPGVLDHVSPFEVTDIICGTGKDGLIDYTSAHDDDLVPWNPENLEDDLDDKSETSKSLRIIKDKLDRAGIQFKMISCNLHSNPVFRNGGIANPDPRTRLLAARKVMRALRIGSFLGADYFTYWVARDGFETQFAVPWERTFNYIKEGLNLVRRYIGEKNLTFKGATIEHKPNEPRGEMFLPTVGHALALIMELEDPNFWGVNPEVLQHDQMAGLTSVAAVAFAASMGKLFFLHIGNQKPNQYDNDNPVLVGMDGIKEFISIIYLLHRLNWKGYVEFDNHMLRTDTAPGEKNKIELRRKYIELVVDAYRVAEEKAIDLVQDRAIAEEQKSLWDSYPEIAGVLSSGKTEKILNAKVDYHLVCEQPITIGKLDMLVNRKLLGID
ncbi:MAG: TIM barrel protein [Spirochaetota bacterium]